MALSAFGRPKSFILVWPGDDPETRTYGGEAVLMPARNEVAVAYDPRDKSTEASRYRFGSAEDRQGKPIPGTVLLRDIVIDDPLNGGTKKAFNAEEWCEGIFINDKPIYARGFRIVMEPGEVEAAMTEGRPLWERAQEAAWEQEVRDEYARQKKYEEKNGSPAPPSSSHGAVKKAIAGLQRIRREQKEEAIGKDALLSVLPGGVASPLLSAKPIVLESDQEPDEPDVDAMMAASALRKAAKDAGIILLKADLEGLLDLDAKVMAKVQKQLEEAGAVFA